MRDSQANGVPLDNDQAIEGFSAAVVWRGSFCDDSSARLIEPTQGLRAGDQIERAGTHRLLERINIGDR